MAKKSLYKINYEDNGDEPHEEIKLPESFQKARRSYVFVSFVLLAWEFIGLSVESISNETLNISIESPSAVPVFLLLSVLYLSYRQSIEWRFLGSNHQENSYVLRDYILTNIFAGLSISIYLFQSLSGTQLFEAINFTGLVIGLSSTLGSLYILRLFDSIFSEYKNYRKTRVYLFILILLVLVIFFYKFIGFPTLPTKNPIDYVFMGIYFSIFIYLIHPIIPSKYVSWIRSNK